MWLCMDMLFLVGMRSWAWYDQRYFTYTGQQYYIKAPYQYELDANAESPALV